MSMHGARRASRLAAVQATTRWKLTGVDAEAVAANSSRIAFEHEPEMKAAGRATRFFGAIVRACRNTRSRSTARSPGVSRPTGASSGWIDPARDIAGRRLRVDRKTGRSGQVG